MWSVQNKAARHSTVRASRAVYPGVPRLGLRFWSACLAVVVLSALALMAHRRLLCAGLFLRLEQQRAPAFVVHYGEQPVEVRPFPFEGGRALLYRPRGVATRRGLVLAHGMHEGGIDEPRMTGFARALAGAGLVVLTPEVSGLKRYRITHDDVDAIARAARLLAAHLGRAQVPVFGISFGGGLALRAACEREKRAAIERVIALGAHQDAVRVTSFYWGAPALGPDGERASVEPHPYGPSSVWMALFGEKHRGAFRDEERARALAGLAAHAAELERASPSTCPEPVRVPVHLVHGTGDRVVPYTETLWNARQLAPRTEVEVLISPAIVHAEYEPPSWWERVKLVEFIVHALF